MIRIMGYHVFCTTIRTVYNLSKINVVCFLYHYLKRFLWNLSEAPVSAIHEEGNLTRKHEWEAHMRKAKDR